MAKRPKMPKKVKRQLARRPKTKTGKTTLAQKKAFLKVLAATFSPSAACEAASVERGTMYNLRLRDKVFARKWDDALTHRVDRLEQSAMYRASDGWDEPIYHDGKQVGTKRRYAPALTIFMLKSTRPERYNLEPGATSVGTSSPHDAARKAAAFFQQAMEQGGIPLGTEVGDD